MEFGGLGPTTINMREGLRRLLCWMGAVYWLEVYVGYSYAGLYALDYHEKFYCAAMVGQPEPAMWRHFLLNVSLQ